MQKEPAPAQQPCFLRVLLPPHPCQSHNSSLAAGLGGHGWARCRSAVRPYQPWRSSDGVV